MSAILELPRVVSNSLHPTVAAFSVRILAIITGFALQAILVRSLGPTGYGRYAYALAWVSAILPFALLGFDKATLRFVAQYHTTHQWSLLKSYFRESVRIVIAGATIATIVTMLLFPGVARHAAADLDSSLCYAALLLVPLALCELFQSSLRARGQVAKGFAGKLILSGTLVVFTLAASSVLDAGFAPSHALILHLFAAIIAVVVAGHWARASLPRQVIARSLPLPMKTWLGVSIPFTAMALLQFLKCQFTILLCGHLLTPTDAGIYAFMLQLSATAAFGFQTVTLIVAPRIAVLHEQKRSLELQLTSSRCAWLGTIISLLALSALTIFGKTILVMLAPAFLVGYSSLIVLLIGMLLDAAAGPVGYLLTMTGNQWTCVKLLGCAAILNVVVSLLMIPSLGILGAAIGNAISLVVWNILMIAVVRRRLGIWSVLGRLT